MELFEKLNINEKLTPTIDWDLVPAETFAIFESWGGKDQQRLRSANERHYYFFVDGWQSPAKACLMERGIKHARVLATIDAPQDLIDQSVKDEGRSKSLDRNYAVNNDLKQWLRDNVVNSTDLSMVHPIEEKQQVIFSHNLPKDNTPLPHDLKQVQLKNNSNSMAENEIADSLSRHNFYDSSRNQDGSFDTFLVDNGDKQTITDKVTGLMWQQSGTTDLTSIRKMNAHVERLNDEKYAGFSDWRLPTMEEAFSLMTQDVQENDLHMNTCFKDDTPFIFVSEKRNPGGYWFCDYKQGTVFWASGTIPGGFGKMCRTV